MTEKSLRKLISTSTVLGGSLTIVLCVPVDANLFWIVLGEMALVFGGVVAGGSREN